MKNSAIQNYIFYFILLDIHYFAFTDLSSNTIDLYFRLKLQTGMCTLIMGKLIIQLSRHTEIFFMVYVQNPEHC